MKSILAIALAASLSACATTSAGNAGLGDRLAAAAPLIDAVQQRYDRARAFAALFLPYLPPARAAQLRAIGAVVEQALAAARTATSVGEQAAEIQRARDAAAQFAFVGGV
jgi:hypothetical protein